MTTQLIFKSHILDTIEHNGTIWFTASTLATALEYSRGDKISQIYNRNAEEFSSCMSITLKLKFKGINNSLREKDVRIFSLRGAHLIAMIARTPVAKEFRKWVLDILDGEYLEHNPQSSTVIAPHRECLPKMVYHSTNKHKPYRAYAWDGVKKRTYLGSYPVVEEAVAAQEHFMQKGATEGIQTDLKFVPKDGRYTVRIEEGQVVAAKAIADKSLVDTKAYRRLRTDILTAQSVLNELLNRMRIVQGEQSISCVDTPLLEAITR